MSEPEMQIFASVWDALEETPERAAALRLRSDLLYAIVTTIHGWGTTRPQVEARLGLTPSKLDDILRDHIDRLSLDELLVIANRAGVTVRVEPVPAAA